MPKIKIYHGTSEANARKIMKEGFKTRGVKKNWAIESKDFVYFSLAYAPFYAMNNKTRKLAIICVEIDENDLYPEDDFVMHALGKPLYTQEDIDNVDFESLKPMWKDSLRSMGNVAAKPDKVKILGVRFFDGKHLLLKCDPVINPINYMILGGYYLELTEWIMKGEDILKFKNFGG